MFKHNKCGVVYAPFSYMKDTDNIPFWVIDPVNGSWYPATLQNAVSLCGKRAVMLAIKTYRTDSDRCKTYRAMTNLLLVVKSRK